MIKYGFWLLCLFPVMTFGTPCIVSAVEEEPIVRIELIADKAVIVPGESFRLGILFHISGGAHMYWRNPGDAGLPPSVDWELPEGFRMDELRWPVPHRQVEPGGLSVNVYEGEVLLFTDVFVPENCDVSKVVFKADAQWMVCKEFCTLEESSAELSLKVGGGSKPSEAEALFDKFNPLLPVEARDIPYFSVEASWNTETGEQEAAMAAIVLKVRDNGMSFAGDAETVIWYRQPTDELISEVVAVDENDSGPGRLSVKINVKNYSGALTKRPYDWGLLTLEMKNAQKKIISVAIIVRFD